MNGILFAPGITHYEYPCKKEENAAEPWQIFRIAKRKLSQNTIQQIFGENARLIDDWAADPRYCNETFRNPIQEIRDLFFELDRAGYADYVRDAIEYLSGD